MRMHPTHQPLNVLRFLVVGIPFIPHHHLGRRTGRVVTIVEMRGDRRILLHRLAQQPRLLGVEHRAHEDIAVALEGGALVGRQIPDME